MSGSRVVLEIIVFGEHGLVGSLMFTSPQRITVGRDPHAMVHLDDSTVSLRHALISLDASSVHVRDLGSRTGTWVNGEAISEDLALRPTDEISIGTFRLRQTIHRREAAQAFADRAGRGRPVSMPTPFEAFNPQEASTREVAAVPTLSTATPADGSPTVIRPTPGIASRSTERSAPKIVELAPPIAPPVLPQQSLSVATMLGVTPTSAARSGPPAVPGPAREPGLQVALPASTGIELPTVQEFRPPGLSPRAEVPPAKQEGARLGPPPIIERSVRAADEDDDEDEDDDRDFIPPFDLIAMLSRGGFASPEAHQGAVALEVVRFRKDRVVSIRHVGPGQPLRVVGAVGDLGAHQPDGNFVLNTTACRGYFVRKGGRRLTAEEAAALGRDGRLPIVPGMEAIAELEDGDAVMIHAVPQAPALSRNKISLRPDFRRMGSGALSAALHLGILALVGLTLLRGKNADAGDVNAGRFATITIKEVEMEPPPEPPPPPEAPPPPSSEAAPATAQPQPQVSRTGKPTDHATNRPAQKSAAEESSSSAQNILKALGAPGPTSPEIGAISNLDAMPRGRAGFKVSEAVGKAPGDGLRVGVGGGGGGDVNTKSAAEVGNSVGKLEVHASGNVRARVTAPPQAVRVEGHLDRGEIQKVVNAHLSQVQGCYERQLVKDPGLAGKTTFQWVITPAGAVGTVRVAQSSIRSVDVLTCIQAAIQHWKFPTPEGGSVTVTYPFAFSSFGN